MVSIPRRRSWRSSSVPWKASQPRLVMWMSVGPSPISSQSVAKSGPGVVAGGAASTGAVSASPPSQVGVLGRLDREGPRTVADLATAERVSHQAMTRQVAALAEAGLVEASVPASADDRRRKPLALTSAGAAALQEQRALRSSHLA